MQLSARRTFAIERSKRAPDAPANQIEMAISSEEPVERYFGIEILEHTAQAIDLSRLEDGRHPLLVNHCTDDQVGVIGSPVIGEDRKLRVTARFGRSAYAVEIRQDVEDEIRTLVSVGYLIQEVIEKVTAADGTVTERKLTGEQFEREMREKFGAEFYRAGPSAHRAGARGANDVPTYVVTRWQPFEASVVPIPADVTVGVGRSAVTEQLAPKETAAPAAPAASAAPLETRSVKITMEKPDPNPAEQERARSNAILDLAKQYERYVTQAMTAEAIRGGHTVEQFKDKILGAMESSHTDTRSSPASLGLESKDKQRYSLARACAAIITGDWSKAGLERACSEAVSRNLGTRPSGFFMPYDAFHRDFTVGGANQADNLVATELRGDLFADVLRNKLVAAQLGVRMLFGLTANLDIPKKTVAGTVAMAAETGALGETQPTTAKVSLAPKRIGGFTQYSKQAIIQSSLAIEPLIRSDLLDSIAVELQNQWLNGDGAGNNIRGLRNTSGVGSVVGGVNGAQVAWSHFVDLESACANVNAEPDTLAGYLINTKVRGAAKKTQKATNLPFIWDNGAQPLNGYRAAVTNTVPSDLTKGTANGVCSSIGFGSDWSQSIMGFFGAPDIVVDPFTQAGTGMVQITIQQFADAAARLAACFAFMDDALTA